MKAKKRAKKQNPVEASSKKSPFVWVDPRNPNISVRGYRGLIKRLNELTDEEWDYYDKMTQ